MVKISIDSSKCDGADCGECADVCSMEVLVLEGNEIVVKCQEECSLCEVCLDVCPRDAISLEN